MPLQPNEPARLASQTDPAAATKPPDESAAPPERRAQRRADDPDITAALDRLIEELMRRLGGPPTDEG